MRLAVTTRVTVKKREIVFKKKKNFHFLQQVLNIYLIVAALQRDGL